MNNLNDESSEESYSDGHERNDDGAGPRNAESLENVHHPGGPDSPVPRSDRERADRDSLAEDRGLAPYSNVGSPQPTLPGFAYAERSVRYHSGPLPSPQVLADYDHVRPGTADWIVATADRAAMAEAHAVRTTADAEAFALRLFAIAAVSLPALVLVVGGVLALFGVPLGSYVALVGGIGYVIETFAKLVSSSRRKTQREGDEGSDV